MATKQAEWVEVGLEEQVRLDTPSEDFEGVYLCTEDTEIAGRTLKRHVFGRDGQPDAVILGGVVLDRKLAKVQPGQHVRIQYVGDLPTAGGTRVKQYRVWVRKG